MFDLINPPKRPETPQLAAVLRRRPGLSRLPMAIRDFAIPQNRADATILREVEGVLPVFPSLEVVLRVPSSRYRRVDRAVAAAR